MVGFDGDRQWALLSRHFFAMEMYRNTWKMYISALSGNFLILLFRKKNYVDKRS